MLVTSNYSPPKTSQYNFDWLQYQNSQIQSNPRPVCKPIAASWNFHGENAVQWSKNKTIAICRLETKQKNLFIKILKFTRIFFYFLSFSRIVWKEAKQ